MTMSEPPISADEVGKAPREKVSSSAPTAARRKSSGVGATTARRAKSGSGFSATGAGRAKSSSGFSATGAGRAKSSSGLNGDRKRRPGPRALRIEASLRERMCVLMSPDAKPPIGRNEREIADVLAAGPAFAGRQWDPAAVRRVLRAIREERAAFFERLVPLLADVDAAGGMSRWQFTELCVRREFDRYWLWDRFRERRLFVEPLDADDQLAPPVVVDHRNDHVAVSPAGRGLATFWQAVGKYSPEALDVLATMAVHSLDGEHLPRLCRRYHAGLDEMVAKGLVEASPNGSSLQLSERGKVAGDQWSMVDGQAGHKSGIEERYWPLAGEEKTLPPDWDWKHRPFPVLPLTELSVQHSNANRDVTLVRGS
jgi:hypothetical protein